MRLGISSYCMDGLIKSGEMTLATAIGWAAEQGAECVELVPFAFGFEDGAGSIDTVAIGEVRAAAERAGIALSGYSVLADLCSQDDAVYRAQIARIKRHVDIAAALGVPRMRHDISAFRRPRDQNGVWAYDALLPRLAAASGEIADYAGTRGIMTLVENHGFFVNGCYRVERLLAAVGRDDFGLLLDTGNIACVDEDPAVAALRLASDARLIHLKDFYIRKEDPGDASDFDCSGAWFRSMAGRYLRGAILGQGDLDIRGIIGIIKASGYDGDIVIEFEGMEDARYATRVSLDNARRIWNSV